MPVDQNNVDNSNNVEPSTPQPSTSDQAVGQTPVQQNDGSTQTGIVRNLASEIESRVRDQGVQDDEPPAQRPRIELPRGETRASDGENEPPATRQRVELPQGETRVGDPTILPPPHRQ